MENIIQNNIKFIYKIDYNVRFAKHYFGDQCINYLTCKIISDKINRSKYIINNNDISNKTKDEFKRAVNSISKHILQKNPNITINSKPRDIFTYNYDDGLDRNISLPDWFIANGDECYNFPVDN